MLCLSLPFGELLCPKLMEVTEIWICFSFRCRLHKNIKRHNARLLLRRRLQWQFHLFTLIVVFHLNITNRENPFCSSHSSNFVMYFSGDSEKMSPPIFMEKRWWLASSEKTDTNSSNRQTNRRDLFSMPSTQTNEFARCSKLWQRAGERLSSVNNDMNTSVLETVNILLY